MRNSALIKPRFFIAGTGRQILREHGRDVALTAIYLMAGPHSHMCGLYYLPVGTAAEELGIGQQLFSRDMDVLDRIGFCRWDRENSLVWVINMMRHQVSEAWKPGDKRIRMIRQHLSALPDSALITAFRRHYGLHGNGASDGAPEAPCQAPWHGGPIPNPSPPPSPSPDGDGPGGAR